MGMCFGVCACQSVCVCVSQCACTYDFIFMHIILLYRIIFATKIIKKQYSNMHLYIAYIGLQAPLSAPASLCIVFDHMGWHGMEDPFPTVKRLLIPTPGSPCKDALPRLS